MTQDEARQAAHLLLGPSRTCKPCIREAGGFHCTALCERIQARELEHARERDALRAELREAWGAELEKATGSSTVATMSEADQKFCQDVGSARLKITYSRGSGT